MLLVYSHKITDPTISTSAFIVLVCILMAIVVPCLDWILNGVVPNMNQVIGYILAVGAIYFLSS